MVSCISFLMVVALAAVASAGCLCPALYAPVCASNGKVYSNACMVRCYNRDNNADLKIVHDGRCGKVLQDENEIEAVSADSADICPCTREYMPVCGSDHRTYSNKCLLKCAAKKNNSLKMLHDGRCGKVLQDENEIEAVSADSADICPCTREYMPVCGSDHRTYSNKCLLKCAAKKNNSLKIVHDGRCGKVLQDENEMEAVSADSADICPCTREYMPVCGSDHRTYSNKCLLKCAAKKNNSLKIVHDGRCGKVLQDENEIEAISADSADICPCTREYMPVCGSDHRTYSNKCLLKCAAKKNNSLKIVHDGRCGKVLQDENEIEAISADSADICPCTREYMPVCGSDHRTYSNKCLLKCAAKKNNSLKMLHDGGCDLPILNLKLNWPNVHEIPEIDDIPDFGTMVEEQSAPCICTMEYMPVCGSNFHTYANKCMLKCDMKTNKSLKMLYPSACVKILP